jgi:hypothetical protein
MKIFLYTISDYKPYSIDCIDLLLSSIIFDIDYDFFIVSNNEGISNNKYQTILDNNELSKEYIGYLKYSPLIPKNYDYYIYLDSDILYFDKLSNLFNMEYSFSIVKENPNTISDHDWYYFKYHTLDENNTQKLKNSYALNAGSFAIRGSEIFTIDQMYNLYKSHFNNDIGHDVRLEQSIYNYIIHSTSCYDLSKCYDITDTVKLFASNTQQASDKKLYHFCGFTNEMASKYKYMKEFYDKYQR